MEQPLYINRERYHDHADARAVVDAAPDFVYSFDYDHDSNETDVIFIQTYNPETTSQDEAIRRLNEWADDIRGGDD